MKMGKDKIKFKPCSLSSEMFFSLGSSGMGNEGIMFSGIFLLGR
jgi:hypothetical protein